MKIMKLSNALTTPTAKYFANEEVAGLFKIFGYDGYKKKFDPDKFKPEKVVIATDADADGDHITFLVFTMFLRYLPFVIEQGKLYIANPPLYGAQIGKQKKFFANNIDYIEFVQNTFCKEYCLNLIITQHFNYKSSIYSFNFCIFISLSY